jgi:hypothetical protein
MLLNEKNALLTQSANRRLHFTLNSALNLVLERTDYLVCCNA